MGAGNAIGESPIPLRVLSAPVGGPLASVRPAEASILRVQLLYDVVDNHDRRTCLLIFVWSFSTSQANGDAVTSTGNPPKPERSIFNLSSHIAIGPYLIYQISQINSWNTISKNRTNCVIILTEKAHLIRDVSEVLD